MNQEEVRPILKALGDDTRYRIYMWLRDVATPCTVFDVSQHFALHSNTVRPHLEHLRDAGLVRLDATPQGGVGRPQHRYTAVDADIELHRAQEGHELLARMLVGLCCRVKVRMTEAVAAGRELGREVTVPGPSAMHTLGTTMGKLGFEPAVDGCEAVFTRCPFRALAESFPDLVCSLHQGLVEGVLDVAGAELADFHALHDTGPCTAVVKL